jgi:hypothetical protein
MRERESVMEEIDLTYSDVMIDLETLGTAPGSVILSIGAVAFAEDVPEAEWRRFSTAPIAVSSCHAIGLTTDAATVEWWKRQDPEARKLVERAEAGGPGAMHIVEALQGFAMWMAQLPCAYAAYPAAVGPQKLAVWGNGSDFDNVLLGVAYARAAVTQPWRYSSNRCFRTMKMQVPAMEPLRQGTHHNALDDALHQTRWLQSIWKYLDEKGAR